MGAHQQEAVHGAAPGRGEEGAAGRGGGGGGGQGAQGGGAGGPGGPGGPPAPAETPRPPQHIGQQQPIRYEDAMPRHMVTFYSKLFFSRPDVAVVSESSHTLCIYFVKHLMLDCVNKLNVIFLVPQIPPQNLAQNFLHILQAIKTLKIFIHLNLVNLASYVHN